MPVLGLILLILSFSAYADCGVDLSKYEVLDQQRFFDKDKQPLMQIVLYGYYPKPATYAVITLYKAGGPVVVVKDANDIVMHLSDCSKEPQADFVAREAEIVNGIAYSTRIPYTRGTEI